MIRNSKLAAVLVTLDPLVTWFALNSGALEGNPIWSSIVHALGITPAMIIRGYLGLLLVLTLEILIAYTSSFSDWSFKILNTVFLIIVSWNLFVLLSLYF